jgi:outer membrane lipoprotein SlyB
MTRITIGMAAIALLALAACVPATGTQRSANCAVGTAGGAALGALAGRELGKGKGRDVATVAGAVGGGLAGSALMCQ